MLNIGAPTAKLPRPTPCLTTSLMLSPMPSLTLCLMPSLTPNLSPSLTPNLMPNLQPSLRPKTLQYLYSQPALGATKGPLAEHHDQAKTHRLPGYPPANNQKRNRP